MFRIFIWKLSTTRVCCCIIFQQYTQYSDTTLQRLVWIDQWKKMCISVLDFYMKIINNKRMLLYNLPTIHSRQRYNSLCVNWPMKNNVYQCIGFLHEIYQLLLYSLPTMHSIQRYCIIGCCIIFQQYTQYNDTAACVNWPNVIKLYTQQIAMGRERPHW